MDKVFNSSVAYNYVLEQCDFGPRNPGSFGHKEFSIYLEVFENMACFAVAEY